MERLGLVKKIAKCPYCSHSVVGNGSTKQAAEDHALLLLNTHLQKCSLAPAVVRKSVAVTIRTAPVTG